jgi:Flp pilus assembly protein TadD
VTRRAQADLLIDDAGKRLDEGNFKENVSLLNEAATIDPANPRVWSRLCVGYQLTEDLELAVSACTHNIKIHPNGFSYNSLALAYMAKKDCPNAVLAFEESARDSKVPVLYRNLVWSLECAQQYDKAIKAALSWVKLSADDRSERVSALENLGALYLKLGQVEATRQAFAEIHSIDSKLDIKTCELRPDNKSVNCSFL